MRFLSDNEKNRFERRGNPVLIERWIATSVDFPLRFRYKEKLLPRNDVSPLGI
jgi:hypothetical protein